MNIVKPTCFIAMAFDHNDTDALYEKSILPVLQANDIIPVIINRRDDNRDINHQIIDLLNSCNFCIADLTYTRPSVYFEAGYAQRLVEVIYTVRSDHLNKNQPDDLRVHFDLQMKPIIKWSSPTDITFASRLERRLKRTVLRQWKLNQEQLAKTLKDRAIYSQMPFTNRLNEIKIRAVKMFSKIGFITWSVYRGSQPPSEPRDFTSLLTYHRPFIQDFSEIIIDNKLVIVTLHTYERLNQKSLGEFGRHLVDSYYPPYRHWDEMFSDQIITEIFEYHILCCLLPVPKNRVMSSIWALSWDESNMRYIQHHRITFSGKLYKKTGLTDHITRYTNVYVLDNLQSLPEYEIRLQQIVHQIVNEPQSNRQEN